jgi:FkbM family methyltransferase
MLRSKALQRLHDRPSSPTDVANGQSRPELSVKAESVSFFQAWLTNESLRFRFRTAKARFRDQRAEFKVIAAHLRGGDIACDIGANKGSYVYWLSRCVGHGRVVAFEPQPDLARRLSDVCRAVGLDNVTVEAKAVDLHAGRQELYIPTGHQPGASLRRAAVEDGSFTTLSVPLVSLDEYFGPADRIALLKIDVEGAELGVLRGAERILRQHAPLLVFECENRHLSPGSVWDVFSYLGTLGYEGGFISHDAVLPISEFDAAIHQRQDGERFWKHEDYCNNFVFRKTPDQGARR